MWLKYFNFFILFFLVDNHIRYNYIRYISFLFKLDIFQKFFKQKKYNFYFVKK